MAVREMTRRDTSRRYDRPMAAAPGVVATVKPSTRNAGPWKSGSDLSSLSGKPIRLRFVMGDADLYSFRFVD